MIQPTRHPRLWAATALGGLFACSCAYAWWIYAPCDDTYIYLVFAKNFLAGHGLTFNGLKVQGFTSVLWMALITAGGYLGGALPKVATVLSVSSGLLVLVLGYRAGRMLRFSRPMALIVPVLVAFTGDFAFYLGNGLESVLFTAMVLLAVSFLFRPNAAATLRSLGLPVVLVLTTLARPEGLLVGGIIVLLLALRARNLPALWRCTAVGIALLAPVLIAMKLYYGDWLPNTYYAKAGAGLANLDQGIQYFVSFAEYNTVLFILALYFVIFQFRALGKNGIAMAVLIVIWFAQVTVQGGDNMVGARAYLPLLPVFYLFLVYGFRHTNRRQVAFAVLFIATSHFIAYNFGRVSGSSWNTPVKNQADSWRELHPYRVDAGKWLKKNMPPQTVVALNAAGVVPYYSELPTIDMLGLNDRHIARDGKRDRDLPYGHQAGDGEYVLGRKPDVILFGWGGSKHGDRFLSERGIATQGEFVRKYNAKALPHDKYGYFRVKPVGRQRRRPSGGTRR